MGIRFRVVRSHYRERRIKTDDPVGLAIRHALGKAMKAVIPQSSRFILAADTIVVLDKIILGKPRTWKEARQMLGMLSGRSHVVITAVILADLVQKRMHAGYDITRVHFKRLLQPQILDYFRKVHPFDKAGGYAIQESPKIVRRIYGSYTNVMGLPKEILQRMLKKADF